MSPTRSNDTPTGPGAELSSADEPLCPSPVGAGCSTHIHIANDATVNIYTCHPGESPPTPDEQAPECPPEPPTGACVPFALGSKPKAGLEERLRPLLASTDLPSSLTAAYFQMARRFLLGRAPANSLESSAFDVFEQLSPEVTSVMQCALQVLDELPPADRDKLIEPGLGVEEGEAVDTDQLAELVTVELLARTSQEAFEDSDCIDIERPGQVRLLEFDEGFVLPINVCTINGLRTGSYAPRLALAEYTPDELHRECTLAQVDGGEFQQNCVVLTEDCPGHDIDGTCLRVPEVEAGQGMILEGVNFFDVDTRVRLEARQDSSIVRDVDAHVCGDTQTPVTETVDGVERTIADCRVRDRLSFQVPEDLPDAIYTLTVIVPNNLELPGFGAEISSSPPQFIRVLAPATTEFQISSETLDCVLETAAPVIRNAGSDEIGIKVVAIPIGRDLAPGELAERNFEFGGVDTGESRPMRSTLFLGSGNAGISLAIIGFEIDNRDAFEQQVRDFADSFVLVLQSTWAEIADAVGELGGEIARRLGVGDAWVAAIAAAITLAILVFVALWAPADLVIEDAIALTSIRLGELTSPLSPPPEVIQLTSAGGIDLRVVPITKDVQYTERREYHSSDQDSQYHITMRYNRLS